MAIESATAQIPPIVIEPHQWEELAAILRTHLPGRRVRAFGSRATGHRVRKYSDLDLVIDGEAVPLHEIALLDEAFDESRLPFKVDVTQMMWLAPEFRARIEPEMVLVQGSNGVGSR